MSQNLGSQFVWFTGVVEDIDDPKMMSRVRVRVFGLHSEKKEWIATEDLPWATVMTPVSSASTSGIGLSPHGLVQGSWVVGFFRDSFGAQDPIIMGSIPSMSTESAQTQRGFYDPDGKYPISEYIDEPDVNKLARGEDTQRGIVGTKKSQVEKVTTATGSWTEPATPFAPKYPFNKVMETESGHILEFDDTEGAERIHEFHKSGTFREIHPDGTEVIRIVKDKYTVVIEDDNCYVKGNVNLTVDANCNMYVKKDWNVLVDGNMNVHVKGEVVEKFDKNQQTTIGSNMTTNVGSAFKETIGSSSTSNVGGQQQTNAGTIDLNADRIDLN